MSEPRFICLQSDEQWIIHKVGCLGASNMRDARAYLKNGAESKARTDLKIELVAERRMGQSTIHAVTGPMQRGLLLEQPAKEAYEAQTGVILSAAALYEHADIKYLRVTPDSPLPLHEFKCPLPHTFMRWVLAGEVPEEHTDQMLAQMAVMRTDSCTFVAYCPELPPDEQLFIREFRPARSAIEHCEEDAQKFLSEVAALERQYLERKAA